MVAINGTSVGYLGTSVAPSIDTVEWASMQPGFGERYWVDTAAAAKVTVVSGTTVRVAAGKIGGHGVVDTFTGNRDLTLPTPGSDGTIYYAVVTRRTWQTTQASSIEYVTGTSARALPSGLNANPGVIDDQPLALVSVTKSGATVTATVTDDLRAVGNKGNYEASSDLVLDYMNKPGYRIRRGGTEWLRTMAGGWEKASSPIEQSSSFGASPTGWSGGASANQSYMFREGRRRVMFLEQRRTGGTISPSPSGHITNMTTFTLAVGDRPATMVVAPVLYKGGSADYSGTAYIEPDGSVILAALTPSVALTGGAGSGDWSIRISASWYTA